MRGVHLLTHKHIHTHINYGYCCVPICVYIYIYKGIIQNMVQNDNNNNKLRMFAEGDHHSIIFKFETTCTSQLLLLLLGRHLYRFIGIIMLYYVLYLLFFERCTIIRTIGYHRTIGFTSHSRFTRARVGMKTICKKKYIKSP